MRLARPAPFVLLAALLAAAAHGQTRRPTPKPTPLPDGRPSVKLVASPERVVLLSGCGDEPPAVPACTATSPKVALRAEAADPDDDTLLYTYSTTGGRVVGEGPVVTLDLTGVAPGLYTVTVEVDDGKGGITTGSLKVAVERCICEIPPRPLPCPTVTVSCPDMMPGGNLTFAANVTSFEPDVTPTFNWKVSAGEITGGQGTSSITVDASKSPGSLTATVDVGGYDRSCKTSASCTTGVIIDPLPRKIDEYGDLSVGDEKRRLDHLTEELRNQPTAEGYLLCYGGRRSRAGEARRRCDRARNFLVISRGIEALRLVTVDGGFREGPTVELWLVPSGTSPPAASPTVDPSEVSLPGPPRKP